MMVTCGCGGDATDRLDPEKAIFSLSTPLLLVEDKCSLDTVHFEQPRRMSLAG